MKWKMVAKDAVNQPIKGTYRDWKALLAEEGYHQCIYCAIHENAMGGIRNFHVEHYRPKSIFIDQENDFSNLFYSCPICNTFKSNDWPNEPQEDNSIASYPNPSATDYNVLFEVNELKGLIDGINVAAKYIQEKLFLNRPQLITERRLHFLLKKGHQEVEKTRDVIRAIPEDSNCYREFSEAFMDLLVEYERLQTTLHKIPHYQIEDTKKK